MSTNIPFANQRLPAAAAKPTARFCEPAFDCRERGKSMQLVVYVPGVQAAGVEIEGRGADLTVTARRPPVVRANWQALHLEGAQRDYRLKLRLGGLFDFAAMRARFRDGVLTVTLPKRRGGGLSGASA